MNPSADVAADALGGKLYEADNGKRLFEAGARPSRRPDTRGTGFPMPDFPAGPPRSKTPKVTRRLERRL